MWRLIWLILMAGTIGFHPLISTAQQPAEETQQAAEETAQQAETDDDAIGDGAEAPSVDPIAPEIAKIQAAVAAYVDAFNSKDVDKLIALWSADGVYASQTQGEQIAGQAALRSEFTAILTAESVPQLSVESDSIEFLSPNVAVEQGTATLHRDGQPATADDQTQYSAVYIKQNGNWILDRVSEQSVESAPSHFEQLQALEWMVGQWSCQGEGWAVEFDCDWTSHRNYISREYKIIDEAGVESSGIQIIGWDAKQKQIRSWLFDSDGGFVSGEWTRHDQGWMVQSVATLADGTQGSSTSLIDPIDDNSYSWQKINRVVDGEVLPNLDAVTVYRN
ncbi:nuclear transport factor 2 family protein [Stieleria sp. TO1_6]|uniref:YybH family protein n=1 Tax=Stieleria tagensis TaxID=2956795 RepID=UPI00209A9D52|nr:nuclear transport factor 2 family protein [Stieleria tagensis]MCO8122345.1 nuclear transport factor 2 family protein [Stieleria tagensis]